VTILVALEDVEYLSERESATPRRATFSLAETPSVAIER
jgi:hypothetical protein